MPLHGLVILISLSLSLSLSLAGALLIALREHGEREREREWHGNRYKIDITSSWKLKSTRQSLPSIALS